MKRLLMGIVIGILLVAVTATSEAKRRRGFGWFRSRLTVPPRPTAPHPPAAHRPAHAAPPAAHAAPLPNGPPRYTPYHYYRDRNPRYYGGFHARQFDNIGMPPGDVGFRGNGLQWNAW